MAKNRSHEDFRRLVAEELAAGHRDEKLWLELYVRAQGNESLARERYVRERTERLMWLANGAAVGPAPARTDAPTPPEEKVAAAAPPSQVGSNAKSPPSSGQAKSSQVEHEATATKDVASEAASPAPAILQLPRWAKTAGGAALLLGVVAASALLQAEKRPETVAESAPAVATGSSTPASGPGEAPKGAVPGSAIAGASSDDRAALARRLVGKWECAFEQPSYQGGKFRYMYEYLAGGRMLFLGAETHWSITRDMHLLVEGGGPESSRADGFMEYRLEWHGDDEFVRTEINYRSTVTCLRARVG